MCGYVDGCMDVWMHGLICFCPFYVVLCVFGLLLICVVIHAYYFFIAIVMYGCMDVSIPSLPSRCVRA